MALQAKAYQDNFPGFPLCGDSQEFFAGNGSGNGISGYNGCGLNLNSQQLFQKQLQQQKNQRLFLEGRHINGVGDERFVSTISLPQVLPTQIDQQAREIDQYLCLQNERLRLAVQEQRKQQMAELLRSVESKAQMLMTQKDQEIAHAARKTAELQELLARLEMEGEAWRRLSEENEAVMVSLNNTLEELKRDRACSTSSQSESCFEANNRGARPPEEQEGTGENRVVSEAEAVALAAACRSCGSRGASMLFLPCRHLCACGPCAAFLGSCPVCSTAKKASIEALVL